MSEPRVVVTAASAAYGPSLLAMLGSLSVNWPSAPPVIVYDLGLDEATLRRLAQAGVAVRRVPPFVEHWRRHFTWKFWCWVDAPATDVLYLDAGLAVLRPLDEIFRMIDRVGYFALPTYDLLEINASEAACQACGVDASFREGRMTVAGGVIGFRKEGQIAEILSEGYRVALDERSIASTDRWHRHDQAIISLLLHKHLGQPLLMDGLMYAGWRGPAQTPGQRIWVHRRSLSAVDQEHLAAHVGKPGPPYTPGPPTTPTLYQRAAGGYVGLRSRFMRRGPAIYDGVRDG